MGVEPTPLKNMSESQLGLLDYASQDTEKVKFIFHTTSQMGQS